MPFCSECGEGITPTFIFCPKCGRELQKTNTARANVSETSLSNKRPCSFEDFFKVKGVDRKSSIKSRKKHVEKHAAKSVNIQVGIMELPELKILRGKNIPVSVKKTATASDILETAIAKKKIHDKTFRTSLEYILCYPDGTPVNFLPGTDEKFSLVKYKEDLGKPYAKLYFYLAFNKNCTNEIDDFLTIEDSESDDEEFPKFQSPTTSSSSIIHEATPSSSLIHEATPSTSFTHEAATPSASFTHEAATPSTSFTHETTRSSLFTHEDTMIRCPVCNKLQTRSEIEIHASICLDEQENPFMCYGDPETYKFNGESDPAEPTSSTTSRNCVELAGMSRGDLKVRIMEEIKSEIVNAEDTELNIPIRRGFAFEDFRIFFSKKWNAERKHQNFCFSFLGEAGIDTGGVSRDFYAEALQEVKQKYFEETDEGFEPSCGVSSLTDGTMLACGQLFAASIYNGGQSPNFLPIWAYKYIVHGIPGCTRSHLPKTSKWYDTYAKLNSAKSDEEVIDIFNLPEGCEMLQMIGYRGLPSKATLSKAEEAMQSIFVKVKMEPLLPALDEIKRGLEFKPNLKSAIMKNPDLFEAVFTPSKMFQWDYHSLADSLNPRYSEDGTSRKTKEITTYKAFLDFIENLFYAGEPEGMKFEEVAKFLTGCSEIPVIGLPFDKFNVEFTHCTMPSCSCLPRVSTCALTLTLPVHIKSSDDMMESFKTALVSEVGFGLS